MEALKRNRNGSGKQNKPILFGGKKMKTKILLTTFILLLLCTVCSQAAIIIIEISGTVTSVHGSALPSTIYEGVSFTGSYTYNSLTPDSDSSPERGEYQHDSPYGINIAVGGYEFKTASSHVDDFGMYISDDRLLQGYRRDSYVAFSDKIIAAPSVNIEMDRITWSLRDTTCTALSSDSLPLTAPLLTDWDSNALIISSVYNPYENGLLIEGIVTNAVLIPEPFISVFLIMGSALSLRRRR